MLDLKSKHKLILKWVWHSLTTHTSQTGLQIFIACYHLNFSAEWNISTIFNLHWLPPSCQPQASAASGRWCLGREDRLMAFLQSCVVQYVIIFVFVKTRTRSGHPGWRQWWFHSHSLRRSFIVGHFCSVVGLGRAAILRQQRVDFSLSKHANKSEPQNKMKYGKEDKNTLKLQLSTGKCWQEARTSSGGCSLFLIAKDIASLKTRTTLVPSAQDTWDTEKKLWTGWLQDVS